MARVSPLRSVMFFLEEKSSSAAHLMIKLNDEYYQERQLNSCSYSSEKEHSGRTN